MSYQEAIYSSALEGEKRGMEKGLLQGRQEGMREGKTEERIRVEKKLRERGMSENEIKAILAD